MAPGEQGALPACPAAYGAGWPELRPSPEGVLWSLYPSKHERGKRLPVVQYLLFFALFFVVECGVGALCVPQSVKCSADIVG